MFIKESRRLELRVPDKDKSGRRAYGKSAYGKWGGNPRGTIEAKHRCVAEVQPTGAWTMSQCRRLRGHGPDGEYCKQHAKKVK